MIVGIKNECDHCIGCQRCNRNVKRVVAKGESLFASLTIDDGFITRTKHFCQKIHAGLGKKNGNESETERVRAKWFAKIIGNAGAEEIRQRCEEEVERAGKTK